MKILYISHQKEASGYGRSCRDYLNCLKHIGCEITSFPIRLGRVSNFEDETEKNSIYNSDIVISHVLPHFLSYDGSFDKNIAISLKENVKSIKNSWDDYLNMMDTIICPIYQFFPPSYRQNVKFGGENGKIKTIPHPIDIEIYKKEYPKMNIPEAAGTYKFYTIGEAVKRKNLSALITAFLAAFTINDPVSLIIKTSKAGIDPRQTKQEIEDLVKKIAAGMRIFKNNIPRIFIISDNWTDDQVYGLHNYGDCFVSTSYAEALCYPMIDACGFNKYVLSSSNLASDYYKTFLNINVVSGCNFEPCYGELNAFDGEYTYNDYWHSVRIVDLTIQLKNIYKNSPTVTNDMTPLSYESVSKEILKVLV
jgi:glycosyltransferase involved in cell wall biosynthesis